MNDIKNCRRCEHCGKPISFGETDYCAICSRNLCERCMETGCCGHVPAKSGLDEDYGDDGAGGETSTPKAPAF